MSGDGFHASVDLNLCKSLVVMLSPDTEATARARRRYRSRSLALVLLDMCHDPCVRERMSSGQSGQLSGVRVRPMNVLSEKSKHSSCSSIHILNNHALVRGLSMRSTPAVRIANLQLDGGSTSYLGPWSAR